VTTAHPRKLFLFFTQPSTRAQTVHTALGRVGATFVTMT
jgi:hypothetical protein